MTLGPFSSGLEWAAAIRARQVSPLEVLDLYLDRIDRYDAELNTYILLDSDQARRTAAGMGDDLSNGNAPEELPPFYGVPLPIKGLNDVEGWPNRYCSLGVPEAPAASDDPYVARFRSAGFVFTGLTTSPEFGSVSVTESALHGATRNPWNRDYSPGGSSGGGAAGLAAGMAAIAHGSDGGGSIRGPASFCGLVGLKPSRGRVSDSTTQWPGFSVDGVLSRTVADTAAALDIQATHDERRWYIVPQPERPFAEAVERDPTPLRIGILRRPGFPVEPDAEANAAVSRGAEILEGLGHHVEEIDPNFDQAVFEHLFITTWTASHGALPGVEMSKVEPLTQELNRRAQSLSVPEVFGVIEGMQQLTTRAVQPWLDGTVDMVITPTTPRGAPPIGWLFENQDTDPMSVLTRAYDHAGFVAPYNMFGLPAITLPLYTRSDGMPAGVQFVGGPRQDWQLLQLAGQVERAVPWRHLQPSGYEPTDY